MFFLLATGVKWEHSRGCAAQSPVPCDSHPLHQQGERSFGHCTEYTAYTALKTVKMLLTDDGIYSLACRKRRMQVSSARWGTTVSEKASPFSITPTTGKSCTLTTCSHWWPSSSSTSPWTRTSAWSAKCTGITLITAKRIATRDDSILNSVSTNHHDLWTEYLLSLPILRQTKAPLLTWDTKAPERSFSPVFHSWGDVFLNVQVSHVRKRPPFSLGEIN